MDRIEQVNILLNLFCTQIQILYTDWFSQIYIKDNQNMWGNWK